MKSGWNSRPRPEYTGLYRTGYLAGYSDGFHGAHFGAGYEDPPPSYKVGFDEGRADAKAPGPVPAEVVYTALDTYSGGQWQTAKAISLCTSYTSRDTYLCLLDLEAAGRVESNRDLDLSVPMGEERQWRVIRPTGETYAIIRLGQGCDPVIAVTPGCAGPDTPGAKFFEKRSWAEAGDKFVEISARSVMMAFSGHADGWGFAELPAQLFGSIEEIESWIAKRKKR